MEAHSFILVSPCGKYRVGVDIEDGVWTAMAMRIRRDGSFEEIACLKHDPAVGGKLARRTGRRSSRPSTGGNAKVGVRERDETLSP